jgi:HNH endonuclease
MDEDILCACGCGESRSPLDKKGRPRRFIKTHFSSFRSGEKHPQWKGGIRIDGNGYMMKRVPAHPYAHNSYVAEHRLVMENYLGRYLLSNEMIHHKDGNIRNNNIENLELMNKSQHLSLHRRNGDCVGGRGYGTYGKAGKFYQIMMEKKLEKS